VDHGDAQLARLRDMPKAPQHHHVDHEANAPSWFSVEIREDRNIGDLKRWQNHDAYQRTFERVLRDLRAEAAAPSADN
jgi:hypothetical protein